MWRQVYVRLRSFFRWRRQEVELDEEIRFHLTEEMEDQIAEGLSPAAARAAARRDFGNLPLIRELTRETWGWGVAERLLQDVRSAVRQLRARPAFTVAVVGILGLGIGANTAMFAIVNGVLLKPLPYPRPDRLVHIDAMIPSRPGGRLLIMRAENADIWRSASSIVDIAFYARPTAMTLTRPSADVEVHGSAVSVETLSLLGVPPLLGRVFDATDIRNSRDDVVVLSHLIWQRHFRADEAIVGQVIEVDRRLFTVVGVMPEHFYFPDDHSDFWFPASSTTAFSFARLRDTVTISAATAEFNTIAWSIEASRLGGVPAAPALSRRPTFRMSLDSMQERIVRRVRPALLALMGAVGLLLLLGVQQCCQPVDCASYRSQSGDWHTTGTRRDTLARIPSTRDRVRGSCCARRSRRRRPLLGRHLDSVGVGPRYSSENLRSQNGRFRLWVRLACLPGCRVDIWRRSRDAVVQDRSDAADERWRERNHL